MSSSQFAQAALSNFIETEKLPASFLQTVEQWYIPLAQEILEKVSGHQGTFVVGIHGCQGSGKSTLAALLVLLFQEMLGIRSINLSLDDFYLSREERVNLSAQVHPLLITRGVPGTHDVNLAMQTLAALKQMGEVSIPRFDKAIDDRAPESQWPKIFAPVDVIIMEGWCLGVSPQQEADLQRAVNSLEQEEDEGADKGKENGKENGKWRSYVNNKLADEYQDLFEEIDMLIMLKAPDFSNVIEWRLQQEEKLKATNQITSDSKIMSRDQLIRFISHYERLTRHALQTVPAKADVVYLLNADQGIQSKLKG